MAKMRFELNYGGVGKLLRCEEMKKTCDDIAVKIQSKSEYIHGQQGDSRYHVLVHTDTPDETLQAFYGEATN